MPFISGCPTDGKTFGELARRELPCSNERRQDNSTNIVFFDINAFVSALRTDIQEKKRAYEAAKKTPIIGGLQALFTRYDEKKDFILQHIIPAIRNCSLNANAENKKTLVETFKAGALKFTTNGKLSGLAKICEDAYFALTDLEKIKSAKFILDVTQKPQTNTVVEIPVKNKEIPVLGTVVPETRSRLRLFNRPPFVVATVDICAELLNLQVPTHEIKEAQKQDTTKYRIAS